MADLNDIMVFARVAKERSFSRAAESLGMPRSTVSERISRLESALGVRLLERTTRSLRLTESGTAYFARVSRVVQDLEEAEAVVTAAHNTPTGVLRIGSPLLFAQSFLAELVSEYLHKFPDVQVELVVADRPFDVLEEELDVAIHVVGVMDAQIIARKLGIGGRTCVASPSYLAGRGTPRTPPELVDHACIIVGPGRSITWSFHDREGRTRAVSVLSRYTVTALALVHRATLDGLGIAVMPLFVCAADLAAGRLVRVLDDWSLEDTSVHLVYPSHRHLSARVRAFVDLVVEHLPRLEARLLAAQSGGAR